jgi:hypothetical protein
MIPLACVTQKQRFLNHAHLGVDDFDRAQALSSAELLKATEGKIPLRGNKQLVAGFEPDRS